jgi:hypothetical protein
MRAPLDAGDATAVSDVGLLAFLGLASPLLYRTSLPRAAGAWTTLTTLRVAGCRYVTDAGVAAALRGCPSLCELDVSRCELLDGAFFEALAEPQVSGRLRGLALAHVGSAASVAVQCRENAARFFAGSPDAHVPAAVGTGGVGGGAGGGAALPPLLAFPRLAVLDVSWCLWLDDAVLERVARALCAAHGLRALSLHACTAVSGTALQRLGAVLPRARLARLDVGQLPACGDEDLAVLIAGAAGAGHAAFAPAAAAAAAPQVGLPALTHLDVSSSRTAERTLAAVGAHCPALVSLRCRVAVRVGGAAFRALIAAARNAAEDRRRRELLAAALAPQVASAAPAAAPRDDAASTAGAALDEEGLWDCASVTDSTTTTATRGLGGGGAAAFRTPERRPAAATASPRSTQRAPPASPLHAAPPHVPAPMPALVAAIALPYLEQLDLWRCIEVNDASLRLVGAHCPRLRELCLEGCDVAVTDAGVVAVASGCRDLRALSLAGVPVSDTALAAVARYCRGLAFLDLSGGADFSRAGLSACVRALPRLCTLRARRCSGVSDGFLRALVRACPLLASLDISSCGLREGESDWVGQTEMGSSAFWRGGAPGPPPRTELSGGAAYAGADAGADANGDEGEDRLTARALDVLAAATRAPLGRLATLSVAFVPAITVEAIYRFVRETCARPGCSLVELRAVAGVATPLLSRLLLRRLVLDEMAPLPLAPAPTSAPAEEKVHPLQQPPSTSVAIALIDEEQVVLPAPAAAAPAAVAAAAVAPRSMRELREAALARLAAIVPGMRIA